MAQLNGLPVYKIKANTALDNKEGIDFISLVDYPAIESNWVAFSKQPQKYHFDQDKQMLYGAILIPNMPIYRFDKKMGEYYVVFEEATIIDLVRKFQYQKKTVNLNYQHQENSQVKDAVVQEIWLTGKVDKSQTFGFDFPVNTAVVGVYVGDKEFWSKEVKSGNVKGFSIEGWLDMELKKHKYMEANVQEGVLKTEAESWKVGADATITLSDGTTQPADGEYKLDNGAIVKCDAGKITEIMEAPVEPLNEAEQAVIQSAMKKIIDPMKAEIESLKTELAALKANKPVTGKNDVTPVVKPTLAQTRLSVVEKIKTLNLTKQ